MSQDFADAFDLLAAMVPAHEEPDDYIQDDLRFCSKCHTPKQMHLEVFSQMRIVPVMCACRAKAHDEAEAADKARQLAIRRENRRSEGISDLRWHTSTFDHDDHRDPRASQVCRNYADNFQAMLETNSGLLLYGDVGTGKTYLAACIANAVLEQGRSVVMASLPSLIAQMGADFGDDREEILYRIRKADLLVLDDVGVERSTEYSTEQAYEVINARYKSGKPLIVTTNLSLADIKGDPRLGRSRINDRLIELCLPVYVNGKSRRGQIAAEKRQAAIDLLEGRASATATKNQESTRNSGDSEYFEEDNP